LYALAALWRSSALIAVHQCNSEVIENYRNSCVIRKLLLMVKVPVVDGVSASSTTSAFP
jgi:hypothetical protein